MNALDYAVKEINELRAELAVSKMRERDAFAAGERKGRIAGLREAANNDRCRADSADALDDACNWRECADYHDQEADRLEREEKAE